MMPLASKNQPKSQSPVDQASGKPHSAHNRAKLAVEFDVEACTGKYSVAEAPRLALG